MLIRLFIFSVVLQSLLLAADGDLDTTFGSGGKVITDVGGSDDDLAEGVVIQNDGKIIAAGRSGNGSNDDFALVRYNPNGSLDTTFSGDGKVVTDMGGHGDSADSVAIQSDGKIVAAGYSYNSSNSDFAVVRYTSNGNLDSTFSSDGKVVLDIGGDDDFARVEGSGDANAISGLSEIL